MVVMTEMKELEQEAQDLKELCQRHGINCTDVEEQEEKMAHALGHMKNQDLVRNRSDFTLSLSHTPPHLSHARSLTNTSRVFALLHSPPASTRSNCFGRSGTESGMRRSVRSYTR